MVCTTYGDNKGLSQLQQQQPQHEQHYGHQHQHQQHEPARHSASSTAANRLPTCRRSSPCRLEDSINVSHISVEILTSPFCTCKARLESPTSFRTRYTSSWCCWCNWQQQQVAACIVGEARPGDRVLHDQARRNWHHCHVQVVLNDREDQTVHACGARAARQICSTVR